MGAKHICSDRALRSFIEREREIKNIVGSERESRFCRETKIRAAIFSKYLHNRALVQEEEDEEGGDTVIVSNGDWVYVKEYYCWKKFL